MDSSGEDNPELNLNQIYYSSFHFIFHFPLYIPYITPICKGNPMKPHWTGNLNHARSVQLLNHVLEQKPQTDLLRVALKWLSGTAALS